MMQKPILEIDEVLNEAIMTGAPSIIVEGIDDLAIYSGIFKELPFQVEIYPIETIKDFGEGCDQVINAIQLLESLDVSSETLQRNIQGIIDKDVRDFRNNIPESEIILTLRHYSIESHFCTKELIKQTLNNYTLIDKSKITDDIIQRIEEHNLYQITELYYYSLESLKAALVNGYDYCFSYSMKLGNMKNPQINSALAEKKEELDVFAASHRIQMDLNHILKITKGKWLLEKFCTETINFIKTLPTLCSCGNIETCKMCQMEIENKCMYRLKDGVTKLTLESLATTLVQNNELIDYIINRALEIKNPTNVNLAA